MADEDIEDATKRLAAFYLRQEEARDRGLDTVISVGLKAPPEVEGVLPPGENGKAIVTVWVHHDCNWPTMMDKITAIHEPMIVEWVMPIGKIPPLVTPPQ